MRKVSSQALLIADSLEPAAKKQDRGFQCTNSDLDTAKLPLGIDSGSTKRSGFRSIFPLRFVIAKHKLCSRFANERHRRFRTSLSGRPGWWETKSDAI